MTGRLKMQRQPRSILVRCQTLSTQSLMWTLVCQQSPKCACCESGVSKQCRATSTSCHLVAASIMCVHAEYPGMLQAAHVPHEMGGGNAPPLP